MSRLHLGLLFTYCTTLFQQLTWVASTDPWERVQRQSLAILLSIWTPCAVLVLFLTILASGQKDIRPLAVLTVLSGVSWFLNRHTEAGAWLFVLTMATAAVFGLPTHISSEEIPLNAVYVFSLMIAALMFVPRDMLIVLIYQVLISLVAVKLQGADIYDLARVAVIHGPVLGAAALILITGATQRLRLMREVDQARRELLVSYDATLEGWGKAVDLRDKETGNHSKRVADVTRALAVAYGIKGDDLINLWRGAILHDVGKLGVPDAVLLKPGRLTEEEWVLMRAHTMLAEHFLAGIEFLEVCMDIPRCHHERWNGSGYPYGMEGTQIPVAARMFAIVDVYDALTSNRPYREASTDAAARVYLKEQAGILFDPDLVDLFLAMGQEQKRAELQAHGVASNAIAR